MNLRQAFAETLMITGFVFVMMLLVEYLQVRSAGFMGRWLQRGGIFRTAAVVLVGTVPGCLGAFTDVTLYTHCMISFGALSGAMIAASGDAAFIMLAVVPGQAVLIFGGLFAFGLLVAMSLDRFLGRRYYTGTHCPDGIAIHTNESAQKPWAIHWPNLREWSWQRTALWAALSLFIAGVLLGWLGPESWSWVRWTLLLLALLALFVVLTVPQHFLQEHLYEHVAKRHVPRVFLWVLGVSLAMVWLNSPGLPLGEWIKDHRLGALLIAVLFGLIPDSGPQIIFVTLFAQGIVPLSVLIASAVVQDGHGMLPLLAESPKEFVKVKAVNAGAGLLLGGALLLLGL